MTFETLQQIYKSLSDEYNRTKDYYDECRSELSKTNKLNCASGPAYDKYRAAMDYKHKLSEALDDFKAHDWH